MRGGAAGGVVTRRAEEQPLWQLAVVEATFALVAIGILALRNATGGVVLRLPLATEMAIGFPLSALAGAVVGLGLLGSPLRQAVIEGVRPLRPMTAAAWSIVVVGLLAGLGEELLFRAALQSWIGLGWASLLFGLAHSGTARLHTGISAGKLAYLVATVTCGALLGLLYETAGLVRARTPHSTSPSSWSWRRPSRPRRQPCRQVGDEHERRIVEAGTQRMRHIPTPWRIRLQRRSAYLPHTHSPGRC